MPDHPDREQLAAYEAGDGDRRQQARIQAHLAGCPACAEVVATVGRARRQLALLDEPELPVGLHDRLAAAVAAEREGPVPLRRPAWWQRPATWAAAAVVLLAAVLVPLLRTSDDRGGAGGATAAQSAATTQATAGGPPVLTLAGELSAARLRALLTADPTARQAYQGRGATDRGAESVPAAPRPARPAPEATRGPAGEQAPAGLAQSCVAAASRVAGHLVQAAFVLQTRYHGRPATLLVVPVSGAPGQADVYEFPRNDCSGPPRSSERVG